MSSYYNVIKGKEMSQMPDFAEMLRYLRQRDGFTQRELASRLHMSPSSIGMYESGKRRPKYEEEETIADFFNVDLNTLRGKRIIEDEPETVIDFAKLIPPQIMEDDTLRHQLEEFIPLFVHASETDRDYYLRILKGLQQKP